MNNVREFPISNVHQTEEGFWVAQVGGLVFDRQWGSWQTTVSLADGVEERRDALPAVAARLQAVVKDVEAGKSLHGDEAVVLAERAAATPKRAPAPVSDPTIGFAEAATARIEREKMAA